MSPHITQDERWVFADPTSETIKAFLSESRAVEVATGTAEATKQYIELVHQKRVDGKWQEVE